jgi:DNA protecting protein DprA
MAGSRSKKAIAEREQAARDLAAMTPEVFERVGISHEDLTSLLLLDTIKGFGPQKYKDVYAAGLRPIDVLLEPQTLPIAGKRGDSFQQALAAIDEEAKALAAQRAARQIHRAFEYDARIVVYEDPRYPPAVYDSNNPIPILYLRGSRDVAAADRQVACVGSRDTAAPYDKRHREFAWHAAGSGTTIVSGFALGADTIGHKAAYEAGGATVLVMPCGLDRPFPPENRRLWEELLRYPKAAAISEFPFGTAASALTLRKRNKLIVAFARGVLLSQTSAKGGAMNAYRFALEQRKPVATFEPDGTARTSGNKLIAESVDRQQPLEEVVPNVTVFRNSQQEPGAWDAWLHRLFSST